MADKVWLKAELCFGSMFSYRMPDLSPSFALASPCPSPAAFRLALVDAAIRYACPMTGRKPEDVGEEIFAKVNLQALPTGDLLFEPPQRVLVFKFFIKRIKGGEVSFGVREYCLFDEPLKVYLSVPQKEVNEHEELTIAWCLRRLRRLGTTDSLLFCRYVRPLKTVDSMLPKDVKAKCFRWMNGGDREETVRGVEYPIYMVNEIAATVRKKGKEVPVDFSLVNPYTRNPKDPSPFVKIAVVAPLKVARRGENWYLLTNQTNPTT